MERNAPEWAELLETVLQRNNTIHELISDSLAKERSKIDKHCVTTNNQKQECDKLKKELQIQQESFDLIKSDIDTFNEQRTKHDNAVKIAKNNAIKSKQLYLEQMYLNHQNVLNLTQKTQALEKKIDVLNSQLKMERKELIQYTG